MTYTSNELDAYFDFNLSNIFNHKIQHTVVDMRNVWWWECKIKIAWDESEPDMEEILYQMQEDDDYEYYPDYALYEYNIPCGWKHKSKCNNFIGMYLIDGDKKQFYIFDIKKHVKALDI